MFVKITNKIIFKQTSDHQNGLLNICFRDMVVREPMQGMPNNGRIKSKQSHFKAGQWSTETITKTGDSENHESIRVGVIKKTILS